MTVIKQSALVLEGNTIKARLLAERQATGQSVHVDWLRFTALLRNAPAPAAEVLFPDDSRFFFDAESDSIWDKEYRMERLLKLLREIPDQDYSPSAQAIDLAVVVAEALGPDFRIPAEIRKGHDFYRCRVSIERHGVEVGWIGFLSSSDSPRQRAQASTIHCNLSGSACTFADDGWRDRLADIIERYDAKLTRCDLALDFFDGMPGGVDQVVSDYKAGLCDTRGKHPTCSTIGDWVNNRARSFYFGSRENGKQTNVYEKGDQLFGLDALSPWVRVEIRYGNKLRVLPVDILRRPADFFAGASDWHASCLALCAKGIAPSEITCDARRATETVEAECFRNLTWAITTAGPSLSALMRLAGDSFMDFISYVKLPGRLQKFSEKEITAGYLAAITRNLQVGCCPAIATP